MKTNNYILIICIFVSMALVVAPIVTLYILEDKNIYYLNSVLLTMMKEQDGRSDNAILNTVYAKYNGTKYNIKTYDEYEYSVLDYEVEGKHYINENLVKLKELENIGLIKNNFFEFLASSKRIITRTNQFQGECLDYSKKRLFLSRDNFKVAFMSFEVENTTGKIISLKIPIEYMVNEAAALEQYINYLNLNSDDWIYKNHSMISKTKKIEIRVENINDLVSLSIVPYL